MPVPAQCPWPHLVDEAIYVYDRESFEKYKSGEYKRPERCICGAKISYADPVCICLVEQGKLQGDMIVEVPIPLKHLTLDLSTEVGSPSDSVEIVKKEEL